jgi:hypothetical protein
MGGHFQGSGIGQTIFVTFPVNALAAPRASASGKNQHCKDYPKLAQ